jgi:hypothetical protein
LRSTSSRACQSRRRRDRPPRERVSKVAEEPWPAEAAAADDDAVATGLRHHPHGVGGRPDVAVAEDGDLDRFLQRGDGSPVGAAGVELLRGARVQRHGRNSGVGGDATRVEIGQRRVVDALAHLDGDGHRTGRTHGRGDDVAEQRPMHRQRRAGSEPSHLGHRTTHVEVDVIGAVLLDGDAHRVGDDPRVDAGQLDAVHRAGSLARHHGPRLGVAFDERARRHHLVDVEATAIGPAERAERRVGDAGHRRENHRRVDGDGADLERPHHRHSSVRATPS